MQLKSKHISISAMCRKGRCWHE